MPLYVLCDPFVTRFDISCKLVLRLITHTTQGLVGMLEGGDLCPQETTDWVSMTRFCPVAAFTNLV